jgi:hypothetical protein
MMRFGLTRSANWPAANATRPREGQDPGVPQAFPSRSARDRLAGELDAPDGLVAKTRTRRWRENASD